MIRYNKLGYVALNVTDLEKSKDFYENIVGLEPTSQVGNEAAFFTCSRDHHNIILYQGEEPGLVRVGLEVESSEQLDIAFEHFSKAGLNPQEVEREELKLLGQGRSIRVQEPNTGLLFELYSDIVQLGKEFKPKLTKIARLGHFAIFANEFDSALKFFTDVMNFKVSDYIEDSVVFMRIFPNPYHHTFTLAKGDERLHHVNFMASDIDDIGTARNRMLNNEVPIVFGPGRHSPSGAIFLYFLDPDQMTLEYSFGMEEFPEMNPRKPKSLEHSLEILDMWGGKPDPRMSSVGRIFGKEVSAVD